MRRKPIDRFYWFFGYHVFDLHVARAIAVGKTRTHLTTVHITRLLDDGSPDLDLAKFANVNDCAILARVPISPEQDRYILIDGYEIAQRCSRKGVRLPLKVLSRTESYQCRTADSIGEWPNPEN